ncbi:MAG: zinc-dependent metalloprotease [Nocardioidaceae bacterium]|nr:zinc-dependent metalloprotease [Nocardioidaceae bacterium]
MTAHGNGRDSGNDRSSADGAGDFIDWDLAVTTAKRLTRPGPEVSRAEAKRLVDELRHAAARSEAHVRGYTGLQAESATAPVLVVDRGAWVQANADGFKELLRPLMSKVRSERGEPNGFTAAVGSKVTGVEAGGLLAFLSSKVLGQFDPFYTGLAEEGTGRHGGRLLLVAPNVLQVEQELNVDPHDFRLWVCLHEETHRVQFTAVPWLRRYVLDEMSRLVESTEVDPNKLAEMFKGGIERLAKLVKGDSDVSLIDLLQTPEQKAVVERLTAVMSLLEGHADVVMDGVGPTVIPTVAEIRTKFTRRREGAGALDQLLRRLLGLDAKMRQYREGAAFVRGAVEKVGMEGFNAVWAGPENLPTRAEITDPGAWVTRIHA